MNAMELFHQGGFIMYPLFIFSVLAWTVAVHKFFYLKSFAKESAQMEAEVQKAISSNRFEDLKAFLKSASPVITRPHEVLLDEAYTSKEELQDRLSRRLAETNGQLKKNLWILGTISSSAPFVGLFGTVMGIMESFKAIGSSGKSGFSVVAAGIAEALVATAAGIIVAVIAVLFYNYFQTRVNQMAQEFRHKLEDAAEMLFLRKNGK